MDDWFTAFDFVGDAVDTASPADISDGYDMSYGGEIGADIASDPGSGFQFSPDLSGDTTMGDYDGFGFGDDSIPGQSDPYYLDAGGPMDTPEYQNAGYDYSQPQYDSPIGPGLNGTPGMDLPQAGGSGNSMSWFGGVTSQIGKLFTGNGQNTLSPGYGGSSVVYARGFPATSQPSYRSPSLLDQLFGKTQTAYPRGAQPNQSFLSRLFGGSSSQGSGDTTTLMMLGGLALVGVALMARR